LALAGASAVLVSSLISSFRDWAILVRRSDNSRYVYPYYAGSYVALPTRRIATWTLCMPSLGWFIHVFGSLAPLAAACATAFRVRLV